jgi:hypothetical protein
MKPVYHIPKEGALPFYSIVKKNLAQNSSITSNKREPGKKHIWSQADKMKRLIVFSL